MKKARTKRILVLLNQTLKAARDEMSGILRAASGHAEFDVRIFDRNITPEALRASIRVWSPDGILTDNRGSVSTIFPGTVPNCVTLNLDKPRHVPVVYLDFSCPTASSVVIDDTATGSCAANFFLRRKYENFAFVGTNLGHTAKHSSERHDSFRRTAEAAGFSCSSFTVDERHPENWTAELERLTRWIAALPKPCAVMAHADVYARLVNDACRHAKVRIPEQIALIGVDNEIDIADNMSPTLSSILPDFEGAGMMAVETLARLITPRQTPRKPLRVTYGVKALVERESTQDTHGAGRLVDAARGIIAKRAHEGIRVADIARELNVSARLLELHFQTVLGHCVRDELLDYRLDDVCRLLVQSDEPIDNIAMQCGWRTSIALKILFKRRFKMSMRDYRKAHSQKPCREIRGTLGDTRGVSPH